MDYTTILIEFNRFAPKYQIIEMCLAALKKTNDHQEQFNLHVLIGRCYMGLKEHLRAEKYFDLVFEKLPDPIIYYWKGLVKFHLEKDDEAIELFSKSITLNPDHYESYLERGLVHEINNRLIEAQKDLEQAHKLNSDDLLVNNFLGNILYKLRKHEEAEPYYRKASKLGDHLSAFRLKELFTIDNYEEEMNLSRHYWTKKLDAECFASMEKALNMEIPDDITRSKLHCEIGNKYFIVNDLQKAHHHLDKALTLDPANSLAHAHKATVLFVQNREGDLSSATDYFEKAIVLDPNRSLTYFDYSFVPMQKKDMDKTLQLLHKGYQLNPYHANTAFYLGFVYANTGHKEKAIEYLVRADFLGHKKSAQFRKERYGSTVALDFFEDGRFFSRNKQYQKAIVSYEKAIELYEKMVVFEGDLPYITITTAYSNMGISYANLNNHKAEECFVKAIKRDPFDISATNNLGNYYLENKQEEKAIELFTRVKELDPYNGLAYYNTGRIFMCDAQKYLKAIEEFTTAINLSENNINLQKEAYYKRGVCYKMLQQYQHAYNDFNNSGDAFEASEMLAILDTLKQ